MSQHNLVLVLVEDDYIDATAVQRALRRADLDFAVCHFSDGDLALEAIQNHDPSAPFVLVVDVNMPRLPGLDLLEQLRREALLPACPVVVLTTSKADSDHARAMSLGIDAFLSKSDRRAMDRLVDTCRQFAQRHVAAGPGAGRRTPP